MYVCVYIYIHVYVYICIYIYTYMYIYLYDVMIAPYNIFAYNAGSSSAPDANMAVYGPLKAGSKYAQ